MPVFLWQNYLLENATLLKAISSGAYINCSWGKIFPNWFIDVCISSELLHLRALFSLFHMKYTSLKGCWWGMIIWGLKASLVNSPKLLLCICEFPMVGTKAFILLLLPYSKITHLEEAVFEVKILMRIKIWLLKLPFGTSHPFKAVILSVWLVGMIRGKAKDDGIDWFSRELMKF